MLMVLYNPYAYIISKALHKSSVYSQTADPIFYTCVNLVQSYIMKQLFCEARFIFVFAFINILSFLPKS
ncbi:hypothetical protein XENTR_v10024180 [Xenopus tropicalis]|nr:hypothetical protein XENTR_v10024180 [Xenopus tropicalis]